jgi:drug/metabolite transporter (DMT)-like permease
VRWVAGPGAPHAAADRYPLLVTLLATLLLREPITARKVFALLLALVGTLLTVGPGGSGRPLGIALGLAAAVIYAGYVVASSRAMRAVALPASAVIISSAALVYGALVAAQGAALPTTPEGWAAVLTLALVSTVLAVVTFLAGLERVGATNTAMLSTVEPAVGLAALVLGERVSALTLVGGVLILAAVLMVSAGEPARAPCVAVPDEAP